MKFRIFFLLAMVAGVGAGNLFAQGETLFETQFAEPAYFQESLHGQDEWSCEGLVEVIENPLDASIASVGKNVVSIRRFPGDESPAARRIFRPYTDPLKTPFWAEAALAIQPLTTYLHTSFVIQDSSTGEPGVWVGIRFFKEEQGYWLVALDGEEWVKLHAVANEAEIQPVEPQVFYRFKVEIDPESGTYNVAVFDATGETQLDRKEHLRIRLPENMKSGGFNRVCLIMGGGSHGDTVYYGDVSIRSKE